MAFSRHILVLILVTLVLPWGAYLAKPPLAVAGAVAMVAVMDAERGAQITQTRHKCRTGILSGAPCALKALTQQTDILLAPPRPEASAPAFTAWPARDRAGIPPERPPRMA